VRLRKKRAKDPRQYAASHQPGHARTFVESALPKDWKRTGAGAEPENLLNHDEPPNGHTY